eukprot:8399176-Karenia_brevis.AAC.1
MLEFTTVFGRADMEQEVKQCLQPIMSFIEDFHRPEFDFKGTMHDACIHARKASWRFPDRQL